MTSDDWGWYFVQQRVHAAFEAAEKGSLKYTLQVTPIGSFDVARDTVRHVALLKWQKTRDEGAI